jgi:hypothetical protein
MKQLPVLDNEVCQKWLKRIVDETDIKVVLEDKRGSYERTTFYDHFPELKMDAMAYALEEASKKQATFNVSGFASFINEKFRELYINQFENDAWDTGKLIRSVESCRLDLIEWGAIHAKNVARPYFEGHEREDVVENRKKFIDHFLNNKESYFVPKKTTKHTLGKFPVQMVKEKLKFFCATMNRLSNQVKFLRIAGYFHKLRRFLVKVVEEASCLVCS